LKGAKTTTELWPPKPKEFEIPVEKEKSISPISREVKMTEGLDIQMIKPRLIW